mmetsp:Transcript_69430/g.165465  ORF Transcript_69430/g.165465 Transcript_69430/m.165465 type:complete len:283 (-) Transcript_69430:677-1525(-)
MNVEIIGVSNRQGHSLASAARPRPVASRRLRNRQRLNHWLPLRRRRRRVLALLRLGLHSLLRRVRRWRLRLRDVLGIHWVEHLDPLHLHRQVVLTAELHPLSVLVDRAGDELPILEEAVVLVLEVRRLPDLDARIRVWHADAETLHLTRGNRGWRALRHRAAGDLRGWQSQSSSGAVALLHRWGKDLLRLLESRCWCRRWRHLLYDLRLRRKRNLRLLGSRGTRGRLLGEGDLRTRRSLHGGGSIRSRLRSLLLRHLLIDLPGRLPGILRLSLIDGLFARDV